MSDTNLTTSIQAIRTKILNDITTATVDQLLSLSRAAKSVGLTEDSDIENAVNSRVNALSSGATTEEMVKLSNAIKQVRNSSQSALSPSATSDDIVEGTTNKFMSDSNLQALGSAIIPATDATHDLGSPTNKFRDLYLDNNTLYFGTTQFTSDDILNFDLSVQPETLEIQVSADEAGHGTHWDWTWTQSALPYARTAITETPLNVVPLYMQGTYQINNFANTQYGSMTQPHSFKLKWIEGAGNDNLVSWATTTTVNHSHPDINGGNSTSVERLAVNVPSTITPPTLTAPAVTYTVSSTTGAYVFSGTAMGNNPEIGPFYRGGTYTININASGHPFYFTTDNGTNFAANTYFGEYTNGVTGSRTDNGTITFTVPAGAPDVLYYQCGVHSAMRGTIRVKDLAVETNANGNYLIYGQHTQESHAQTIELRPIPTLTSQMCLVYDSSTNKFVPQDLSTYVENTPAFENKIKEVAGTATLIAPDGTSLVASVNIYSDATYLPAVGNTVGDIAFVEDTQKLYIYKATGWIETVANADLTGLATEAFVQNYVANNVSGGNVVEYTSTNTAATNDTVMLNSDGTVTIVEPTNYTVNSQIALSTIGSAHGDNSPHHGLGMIAHKPTDRNSGVVVYRDQNNENHTISSFTASGGSFSISSTTTVNQSSDNMKLYPFFDPFDDTKVLLLYTRYNSATCRIVDIAANGSITVGSIITLGGFGSVSSKHFEVDMVNSTSGDVKIICSVPGFVTQLTWDGTNITAGTPIATTNNGYHRFSLGQDGLFAMISGTTLRAGKVNWAGGTVSEGASLTVTDNGNQAYAVSESGKIAYAFYDGNATKISTFSIDSSTYGCALLHTSDAIDNRYNSGTPRPHDIMFAPGGESFGYSWYGSDRQNASSSDNKAILGTVASNGTITFISTPNSSVGQMYSFYPAGSANTSYRFLAASEWSNSMSQKGLVGFYSLQFNNYNPISQLRLLDFPYSESNLDVSKIHGLAASSGTTIDVTIENGIHTGLSGLTVGSKYYVLENGTFSTSPDSNNAKIGLAITSTSLALDFTDELTDASLATYATKSYVTTQVANLVDSAPATLDTLNELAAALGDDANFSTTVTNSLANKLEASDLNGYATETYVGDQITAAGSYSDASVDSHLNRSTATTGQIMTWNGTDYAWVDASSSISVSETAPASPSNGDMWFDSSNANTYIYYTDTDSSQWLQIGGIGQTVQNITNNSTVFGNPTIASVSPNSFDGTSGTVITIQGTNFDVGTVVSFIDANGVETNAAATSIVTQGELTATIPQAYTSAEGPLDVKVTVGDGQTITSTDAIQTGGSPTWTTASGQLGSSLYKDQTGVSLQIEATDPDGQFVSYEVASGSLAPGLSLAAGTGLITGDITTASITADTNYSFTANANDTAGNSTPRTFFINVLNSVQLVNYVWRNSWGNGLTDGLMGYDYGRSPQFISFWHTAYIGASTNGSLFWGDGNNQSAQQDTGGSHYVNSTIIDDRMNALKTHVDGGGTFDFHISGYNTGANESYTFDSTSSNIYKNGNEWRMGGFSHLSFMRGVASASNSGSYISNGMYTNPKYITIAIPY